jgi:hypothetical protein
MTTVVTATGTQESIYSLIGDMGAVTPGELAAFLGDVKFPAEAWLRAQEQAGYVHRDEFGRYGTSCPWPRTGF